MSKLLCTARTLSLVAFTGLTSVNAQTPTGQPINQPPGTQSNQDDRLDARGATKDSQTQQGPTVKEALTQKLIKANEAEIELAKIAQETTDNEELKQLASMIVKDHQQINQTLQQFAGKQHSGIANAGNQQLSNRTAGQPQSRKIQSGQATSNQTATVPKQLCQVAEQACNNALQMTKEMLSNYEGQDFNMAFLGQQCVAHTMMLAELKAIESVGPEELKQVASDAASKVEEHLQKAKQLAKKLQDDQKSQD